MTESKPYKVAIIGGGPAGTACAINLCRLGVKDVLVIESGEYEKFRIGESIPPESRQIFAKLGILDSFLAENHDPCYGSVSYWGDHRRGYNDSIMSPFGHGWHLDRTRFNRFLANEASKAGVEVLIQTKYQYTRQLEDGHFLLTIKNSEGRKTVNAEIVVDASGSKAVFAQEMGSKKIHSQPLICLAARFKAKDGQSPQMQLTHLEAVEYGWWYTAKLPDNSMLVTLYSTKEIIQSEKLNSPDQWLEYLKNTPHTYDLVQSMEIVDNPPKGFPAPSYCLDKCAGKNWLAIGDAASAYDPITSRGITKSLLNAEVSANIVAKRLNNIIPDCQEVHNHIKLSYDRYLEERQYYYGLEKRWKDSIFWQELQIENFQIPLT
ncbi:MAG: NAD(P)/FAD-dependent oxidoreductase [Bacteroidetes bacterium]|nr:MAG: NAD(P)/FAD-dependent oxidoreductase [Bacteroidota bacterium]